MTRTSRDGALGRQCEIAAARYTKYGCQHGQELEPARCAAHCAGHTARRHAGTRLRRQDHRALPAQVRPVPQHCPHHRVQLRKSQRHTRKVQRCQLPSMGCRWARKATTFMEVLH